MLCVLLLLLLLLLLLPITQQCIRLPLFPHRCCYALLSACWHDCCVCHSDGPTTWITLGITICAHLQSVQMCVVRYVVCHVLHAPAAAVAHSWHHTNMQVLPRNSTCHALQCSTPCDKVFL